MLCLSLQPGEYLTIGDHIVLQYDSTKSNRCYLAVTAPREIPVLRGSVHEKQGGQRPEGLFEKSGVVPREVPWDRSKAQALKAMRRVLDKMEDTDEVLALRRQLEHIFPTGSGKKIQPSEGKDPKGSAH